MPSLKSLRIRINSVKSTRKITQAMKMVAAAKLRRAQSQAEAARPYAERMERMLASLGASVANSPDAPRMLVGSGADKVHLLVVVTADRGLAGPFNTNVGRFARLRIRALEGEGKTVKLLTVGRKGAAFLKREFARNFVGEITLAGKKRLEFTDASDIATRLTAMLEGQEFDVASLVYNRFQNVITQVPTEQRLIPAPLPEVAADGAGIGRQRPVRIRAVRDGDPRGAAAAEPRHPDLPGAAGKRGRRAGQPHVGHGQRHAQCGRHDQQADAQLQPHTPGQHHPRADRDHLRC
jgi:F-type H+-transporting ATPase subunit gamma